MKTRYWIILAAAALLYGLYQASAHQSYIHTTSTAVAAKDRAGGDVTADLAALETYVRGHMLTSASVELKGAYARAIAAAQVASQSNANGQVYEQAQAACDKKGVSSIAVASCVQNYVASHSTPQTNPQPVIMPSQAQYTKSFKSPLWTPDSTGVAILGAILLLILAFVLRPRHPRYY